MLPRGWFGLLLLHGQHSASNTMDHPMENTAIPKSYSENIFIFPYLKLKLTV